MLGLNDARRAGLLGGTALALIAAFGGRAAVALDECGPANAGDTITCTPAGNPFPDGIQYKVNDLTIVVQDGVIIDTTTKANEPGGVVSGGNGNYGDLVVKVGTAAGAGVTITTNADGADGISVATKDGTATITSYADITTSFKNGDAISAKTEAGDISIISTGDLDVDGFYGHGIRALSDTGKITITHTGDIETYGAGGFGIRAITKNDISITVDGDITTRNSSAILAQASAGNVTITFTGDINTKDADSEGLQAVAKDGTVAIEHSGAITTIGDRSVGIDAEGFKGVEINSQGDISTLGKEAIGIDASSKAGNISISWAGDISTAGYGARAILANAADGDIVIDSAGELTTQGVYGAGIFANAAQGGITITHAGDISTKGNAGDGITAAAEGAISIVSKANITIGGQAHGIEAYSIKDDVSIISTGAITTAQDNADAITGFAKDGAVFVTSIGNLATKGDGSDAIAANAGGEGVVLKSAGNIATAGEYAVGIFASSKNDAVTVTSSGTIVTGGGGSDGIAAYGSYVGIVHVGNVATAGENAEAIRAAAESDSVNLQLTGNAVTQGKDAAAIFARSTDAGVRITTSGLVRTFGQSANGIDAASKDTTAIYAGNVVATGRYSSGIFVYSQTENRVTVSGTILGGWDGGVGVSLDQSKQSSLTIDSGGAVGALSDFAIDQDDDDFTLNSSGAIVGSFFFDDGDDALNNFAGGAVHLRQFADSNGDQVRDKEGVALGSFEADKDTFDNDGVLRLATASGATTWDTTGQILHPGGGNSDITQEGVEQGFITGLELFNHSGLITLADGVAGDLLVITDEADGKTKGAGVFKSNGGSLALDVVLDDGSSKQSDVLILDKAELGTGATSVLISNAGGIGGQTTGDGILVVNVRDTSDPGEFVLGNKPVAGAYQYDLVFQNQAKTDQNWYLQSSFFDGSLEYPAIASGALVTWYSDLGGLHERLSERRAQVEDGQLAALDIATDMADSSAVRMNSGGNGGWFRVSGSDMDIEQSGPADFDVETARAEAGFDVGLNNLIAGEDWLVLGAMAGYGWSSLGFEGGSAVDFDIATVGAYATYFMGPYYLDALVKFDWLDGSFNSDNVSQDGDVELPVFGLSLESGYRFDLTPGGLYLQPQAQLSYAHAGSDSFKDDSGSEIELESADSLRGRLGARVGQELTSDSGAAQGNFYLEASVNQEFLGETEAKVSGLTLEQDLPGTTFEIGGGIDIALPKDGVSFTIDADYTLGNQAEGVSATGGFRINW
jgi:outer membrane autotransporter protein